jgi:hypothetical protein
MDETLAARLRRTGTVEERERIVIKNLHRKEAINDRRAIDWRLGWIDRRRAELNLELENLDRQEREVLGLK